MGSDSGVDGSVRTMPGFPFAIENMLGLPESQQRELRDHLFLGTIRLCYEAHPYYSRLMRERGLTPSDFGGVDDLQLIPPTRKEQFLRDPDAFRLDPARVPNDVEPIWPLELRHLWEIVYTTGTTTGVPAPVYTTTFDHHAYMLNTRRRRPFIDVREGDVIGNVLPQTPFPMGAYARTAAEASAYGASIVNAQTGREFGPFGVQRSLDEAIRLLEAHRVTVVWGVASFVRRLLARAVELGADVSSIRLVMFTGEAASQALQDDMRRHLRALGCGDAAVVNRYGSTEQASTMVECRPGAGFHNLAPDQILPEVIDPETGERKRDGESGHYAFTHLMRRGTVLLRYLPGDVTTLVRGRCDACGRELERIGPHIHRSGSLTKIKGTLVDLGRVRELIEGTPGVGEYQIVVQHSDHDDPLSPDELVVRIEAKANPSTAAKLSGAVASIIQVTPRMELVDGNEIFDPTAVAKPRRIVDLR